MKKASTGIDAFKKLLKKLNSLVGMLHEPHSEIIDMIIIKINPTATQMGCGHVRA